MAVSRRLPAPVALAGAAAIGALTAVQARINGVLGVRLDDGIVAGLLSFTVGLTALVAVTALVPSARVGARRLWRGVRARQIPPWMLLGGLCGALTVSTQGVTAAVLGVSLFTVGVVAGQTMCALVLDRVGFGPAGVVAVTPGRVVGGLLALSAVGISLGGGVLDRTSPWLLFLPFLAGAGIAWQSGANGRLSSRVGSPMTATLMSFLGGTVALLLAAGASVILRGAPRALPTEPWLYVGGLLGVVYIFLGALLVAHTGVLLLGLGSVLGQLTASVVIDALWPPVAGPSTAQVVAMVVVAGTSVVVALPRRRR